MRQLIFQDRRVTYSEIKTTLGINGTHTICQSLKKRAQVDWSKEMLQKYDSGASKHVYDMVLLNTYEPENKQQSTVWMFQDEPNPTKVARFKALPIK